MEVVGVEHCDLVVYKDESIIIEKIEKDTEYIQVFLPNLKHWWETVLQAREMLSVIQANGFELEMMDYQQLWSRAQVWQKFENLEPKEPFSKPLSLKERRRAQYRAKSKAMYERTK
jgi:hypothetical protein